jgi:hypothetical protein
MEGWCRSNRRIGLKKTEPRNQAKITHSIPRRGIVFCQNGTRLADELDENAALLRAKMQRSASSYPSSDRQSNDRSCRVLLKKSFALPRRVGRSIVTGSIRPKAGLSSVMGFKRQSAHSTSDADFGPVEKGHTRCLAFRISPARSPIMMQGAIVLPVVTRGIMEPSAIRRLSIPWTLREPSTTDIPSCPILAVHV